MRYTDGETTSLLDRQELPKKEADNVVRGDGKNHNVLWSRLSDMSIGFALCAVIATMLNSALNRQPNQQPHVVPVVVPNPQHVERHTKPHYNPVEEEPTYNNFRSSRSDYHEQESKDGGINNEEKPTVKYSQFQALGFQIYTGGAPALVANKHTSSSNADGDDGMINNPECNGLNSFGHFDDYDVSNTTLPSSLWQCYLGHADPMQDIRHRLQILTDAVERAHQEADDDPSVLKIFVAPEFFWRGREGAYVFKVDANATTKPPLIDDKCTEVCQIMTGLEGLVANKKYKDWLFLFGTVVVSETLPKEDAYDYLFYNFAPVYKGYDPETQDHHGKRFLVPKRYVSNVDFLTPVRQYDGNITKELVDLTVTQKQLERARQHLKGKQPTAGNEPIVVNNPFALMHDFYDRDMWYTYKDELTELGYTMIEYDWLILDNITFTIEVCLDHDARTALNTYLADQVLGSPSRIPKSVAEWDPVAQKYVGSVKEVKIPRHQAQISLVSSMGMTANPQSLALTNNGTLILQDGQSAANGSMTYMLDCDTKSWHFNGGTEIISRTAAITSTTINFEYQIHTPTFQFSVYDDNSNDDDNTDHLTDNIQDSPRRNNNRWKEALHGVFTTTKYEPKVTMYSVREIAKV